MKNIFRFALTIAACSILFSCSEEKEPVVDGATFEMESYDDFWWEEFDPRPVKFVINADFKECDNHRGTLVLALCDGEQNSEIVPTDLAQVYVGGEVAEGNKIRIPASADGEVKTEVEIRINKAKLSDDVTYRWHIKLCDDAGLKKVFSKDNKGAIKEAKEGQPWVLGMDICVKNTHVANSLKVKTTFVVIIFLIALVLWLLFAHFGQWPAAKFSQVQFDYHDGVSRLPVRVGACHKVILTDNPRLKDSLLKKIFAYSTKYEVHPFWTHPIELGSYKKSRSRVKISNLREFYLVGEAERGMTFEIFNENEQKVTITIS